MGKITLWGRTARQRPGNNSKLEDNTDKQCAISGPFVIDIHSFNISYSQDAVDNTMARGTRSGLKFTQPRAGGEHDGIANTSYNTARNTRPRGYKNPLEGVHK